jgi:hypothetical protein
MEKIIYICNLFVKLTLTIGGKDLAQFVRWIPTRVNVFIFDPAAKKEAAFDVLIVAESCHDSGTMPNSFGHIWPVNLVFAQRDYIGRNFPISAMF